MLLWRAVARGTFTERVASWIGLAIEVETGKSDVVWNVKNCMRSRFDKVIVVATDDLAFKKVERDIAKAGLMGWGG